MMNNLNAYQGSPETNTESILNKLGSAIDLPTLPVIASEVNRKLLDGEASVDILSQTLEKDHNIVPKVLRLYNSPFFCCHPEEVGISRAIVSFGFYTIRNLVISLSVIEAFSEKEALNNSDIANYWRHSIGVAMASKHLAQMVHYQFPEEAFTGGLLHDIGKIVLIRNLPILFKKIKDSARENTLSFHEAEKSQFPITHAEIGGYMASKWNLSKDLMEIILFHHSTGLNVIKPKLLIIVHTADAIVNGLLNNTDGTIDLSTINPKAVELMGPHLDTVHEWFPKVSTEIEAACKFFLEE